MRRIAFNEGWSYKKLDIDEEFKNVILPYDCMLRENRSDDSPGGCNNGWFEGYDYEFLNEFERPVEKTVVIEFEGIYHRAEVYCNGEKVGYRPNGYLGIVADLSNALKQGKNQLRVISRGADIPNSRWYTGAGIYRPVNLYTADENYIPLNGVKIKTLSINPAVVEVALAAHGDGEAKISVTNGDEMVAEASAPANGSVRINIPDAKLWSPEAPELYTCKVEFNGDMCEQRFGIRVVTCDTENGFCINGKRVILRGACIHHDNGLLGAATFTEAEERKIKILQKCGFNAIRSAHNPCSKTLLDVCDRLGMMVMDEYADSWYVHKTKYDYAGFLEEWYERDITDLVEKDFNHPCVVLYSLGNEVTETAEKRGVELYKAMQKVVKSLDTTRPVTCGINIGFNQAAYKGHSFFSDEKANRNAEDFKNLGTEKSNHRKWMFGPLFTRLNAILPGCDKATREAFGAMDVAGYNYGILRYKHDRKKYPNRIILGSETFCEDAEKAVKIMTRDKCIIGDFVWTGMDHIGEVGLGAFEYCEYAPTFIHTKGWLTSGSGRVDITGKPLPEAYYMKAAYGLLKKPVIAVKPVNHNGERHSPSGWKFTEAVESWAWTGCEGKKAKVEVYACGACVELYLNNRKVGSRSLKKHCRVKFNVRYKSGTLTAIVFDNRKREISRRSIYSVDDATELRVEPETEKAESGKLCFVRMRLTDTNGITKVLKRERIKVKVEGGELVGLGHACPYNDDGYTGNETGTYYGEALAIIKAGNGDKISINAVCESGTATSEIKVIQ
ncbi:MAG TPA: glycoside hydrolase family 2 [Clostridiales bacterium]|nr:glycoside hydrolase family 2 [Clostridiales bacterium]